MSASLKAAGNAHFAAKEWEKAVELYTRAIEVETDEDLRAPLYSNRCSALMHLDRLDDALADANSCRRCRPSWSKGAARVAEVWIRKQLIDNAIAAYTRAVELAEDSATKMRYVQALKTTTATKDRNRKAYDAISPIKPSTDIKDTPVFRIRRACAEGYKPTPGGSIELLEFVFNMGMKGFEALEKNLWKDEQGRPQGNGGSSTNQSLSECLLLDSRAFCIPPGKDRNFPLIEELHWLGKMDFYALGLVKYVDSGKWNAKTIIADLNRRVPREGWQIIRQSCSVFTRGNIVSSFLNSKAQNFAQAILSAQISIDLLEEGNKVWRNASYEDKGVSFKPNLIRLMKVYLMDLHLEASRDAFSASAKKVFTAEAVETLARKVLAENPHSGWPSDQLDRTRLGWYVIPTVRAYLALGYASARRGREPTLKDSLPGGKAAFVEFDDAKKAQRYYDLAAKLLPSDDCGKPQALIMALDQHLRIGEKKVRDILRLAEEAEKFRAELSRFYGELDRPYPARIFVEQQVQVIKGWLAGAEPREGVEPLDQILAPIPTLNVSGAPASFDRSAVLTEKFWSKLPGDIRFVNEI